MAKTTTPKPTTYLFTCEHCHASERLPYTGRRARQYHAHCKKVVNMLAAVERAQEEWLTITEEKAAAEERGFTANEMRTATEMRSKLMSLSNRANRLGSPKRIRSDRDRSLWWNSTDGQKATKRLASKALAVK